MKISGYLHRVHVCCVCGRVVGRRHLCWWEVEANVDAVLSCDRETQGLTVLLEETVLLESRLDPHPGRTPGVLHVQ